MKLSINKLQKFEQPLNVVIKMPDGIIDKATSFFGEAQIENERITFEISALEYFYPNFVPKISTDLKLDIELSNIDFTKKYFNVLKIDEDLSTNEVFAIESILLSYLTGHQSEILLENQLMFKNDHKENELYRSDTDYKDAVIKVKVGRNSAKQDNQLLKDLVAKNNTLRLDGNLLLSKTALAEILRDVDLKRIEYIEEPFPNISDWNDFLNENPELNQLKLALDENLLNYLDKLDELSNVAAFIIKPTRDFSISGYLSLLKDNRYKDIKLIISSSFEQREALTMLKSIGSLTDEYHGLGTEKFLTKSF